MKKSILEDKIKAKKKRRLSRKIGFTLAAIEIIVAVALIAILVKLNMVPVKYLIMASVLIILFILYSIFSQYTKARLTGKILSVFMTIVMLTGCIYAVRTSGLLSEIGGKKELYTYSVNVLKDDPAASIEDTADYKYGYVKGIDDKKTDTVFEKIRNIIGKDVETVAYEDWQQLCDALFAEKVQAVVFNEVYRSNLNECKEGFSDQTKVIKTFDIEETVQKAAAKTKNQPFMIFLSGNDEEGKINAAGRSDVNLIICVNPAIRQIFIVSTPRDYYITIDNLQGKTGLDKLTHAGIFGAQGSVTAIQNLYQISLDYFLKVNFTGMVKIVDALGGVTINSDVSFTTTHDTSPVKYDFTEGKNECDGDEALAFCRERHAFDDGDFQRGRNQMAAFRAIFDKATSPSIIVNYMKVIDSVSDCITTNMPSETISSLVKDILNDSRPWHIQSYATKAKSTGYAHSMVMNKNLSMDFRDDDSIALAREMMGKVMNGEVFDVNEYVNSKGE